MSTSTKLMPRRASGWKTVRSRARRITSCGSVEGRQQPFDVDGRAELTGARVAARRRVRRQDAVAERLERGELVPGEEPTTRRGVGPAEPREGRSQGDQQRGESLQEIAPPE